MRPGSGNVANFAYSYAVLYGNYVAAARILKVMGAALRILPAPRPDWARALEIRELLLSAAQGSYTQSVATAQKLLQVSASGEEREWIDYALPRGRSAAADRQAPAGGAQAGRARNGTSLQICIPPLPNQRPLNPHDVRRLGELFPGRVHDYSGSNAYSRELRNFYDLSHLRPPAAAKIMQEIY